MKSAVIINAVGTPTGGHVGLLSSVRPDDLAVDVTRSAVDQLGIDFSSTRIDPSLDAKPIFRSLSDV